MSFTPGSKHGQMADINMTPLIDVMLVLLIIFMVAAPMLTTGVDVNLPESKTGKSLESEAITISLARDGRLQFDKQLVEGACSRSCCARRPTLAGSVLYWSERTTTFPTDASSRSWMPFARRASRRWAS